jgi:DNA-directed RNA polymerase specialized sigma24 family protein
MLDSWPEADTVAAIFERLRQGDRLAQSDFIAAVLDPLVSHLRAWRRDADEHMCLTAAEDAVLSVIHNPSVYNPAKGSNLFAFLCMAAKGDLLNVLERERRHHRNRENRDCVELPADGRNSPAEEVLDDLPSFDDPALAAEIACFTDSERQVFELMRSGEKRTCVFADLLDIGHLPVEEQAREVKRVKERIMKRLKRGGGKA